MLHISASNGGNTDLQISNSTIGSTGLHGLASHANNTVGNAQLTVNNTAVNLTAVLHQAGLRVLLCDFDPQANATSGLGLEKGASAVTSYDVVINGAEAKDAVIHTKFGDLIPSSAALSGAGVELVGVDSREYALKNALASLKDSYDAILIDCPPSLELLTLNALCAADSRDIICPACADGLPRSPPRLCPVCASPTAQRIRTCSRLQ